MLFTCCSDSLADDLIDVLNARGDHLRLLLGRLDPVADLLIDLLVVQLLEGERQDLTLSVLAVMEKSEKGDTFVILHSERSLMDDRVVQAIVQERLDHVGKALPVNRQVVLHL